MGASQPVAKPPHSSIELVVYGRPAPQGSKVASRTKDGRLFVREASPRLRDWRHEIARTAREQVDIPEPLACPVCLSLAFEFPRPRSHFTRKGALRKGAPFIPSRPDLSKLVRAVEDALTGILWRDDGQVAMIHSCKSYVRDIAEPRCRIFVYPIE
jgi:Holliday junction resolvase RusA-like endonuclease